MQKEIEYIKKAVLLLGGQSQLAKNIGVTQGAVWKWVHGHKRVSPLNAVAISNATGGQVRASDIRPDLSSFFEYKSRPRKNKRRSTTTTSPTGESSEIHD